MTTTAETATPSLEVAELDIQRLPLSEVMPHPHDSYPHNPYKRYEEDMKQEQAISMFLGNNKQEAWRDSCDAWRKNYRWGKVRQQGVFSFGDKALACAGVADTESFEDEAVSMILIEQIRTLCLRLRRKKILNRNQYQTVLLHGFQGMFMRDVGLKLGLKEARVCQIFHEAIRKIRMFV